jgi:hypothetical protein
MIQTSEGKIFTGTSWLNFSYGLQMTQNPLEDNQ